ncbi:hypothetical protein [Symbioplanes lichenis]|uniref:hypothetical protein n=1 Tax=Symbioplanes lichenis TaxID=1629072 RepID=UPI0027398C10|nr:hypothetical protein [Actinoplanes lichenis]
MLYVGVGVAKYQHRSFVNLPAANRDINRLHYLFSKRRCAAERLADPRHRGEVTDFIEQHVPGHTSALLHWAGHALISPRGELLLALGSSRPNDVSADKLRAEDLIDQLVALGVRQLMLVIDTCGAAAGMLESLNAALARIEGGNKSARRHAWVGVLAASQSDGTAVDGAFGRFLCDLLRTGPENAADRVHWNAYNVAVRGVDVAHAAHNAWDEDREQQLAYGHIGWSQPLLPNPFYDPTAAPAHLDGSSGGKAPSNAQLRADLALMSAPERARSTVLLQVLAAAQGRGMPARDVWLMVAEALSTDEEPFTDADLQHLTGRLGRHITIDGDNGQAVFRLRHGHARRFLLDAETTRRIDRAVLRLSDGPETGIAGNPYLREHLRAHALRVLRPGRRTPLADQTDDMGDARALAADAEGMLREAAGLLSGARTHAVEGGVASYLDHLAGEAVRLADAVGLLLHEVRGYEDSFPALTSGGVAALPRGQGAIGM